MLLEERGQYMYTASDLLSINKDKDNYYGKQSS